MMFLLHISRNNKGLSAQIAVMAGLGTFGPSFLMGLGYFSFEPTASASFGGMVLLAGIVGTPLGGLLIDYLGGGETIIIAIEPKYDIESKVQYPLLRSNIETLSPISLTSVNKTTKTDDFKVYLPSLSPGSLQIPIVKQVSQDISRVATSYSYRKKQKKKIRKVSFLSTSSSSRVESKSLEGVIGSEHMRVVDDEYSYSGDDRGNISRCSDSDSYRTCSDGNGSDDGNIDMNIHNSDRLGDCCKTEFVEGKICTTIKCYIE